MYTTLPLETIDTVNNHAGLLAVIACFAFANLITLAVENNFDKSARVLFILIFFVLPVSIATVVSFTTGEIITYANTKVEAKLVGFVAERQISSTGSGKTHSVATTHRTYVQYTTPDGAVLFPAVVGTTYPETAILYKN